MTKQYLDKRDTDYVRDNLIFNYILGNEQELLIKSFVRNNGIELGFDPQCFYFLITGSHKKYTPPFTPDSFTSGVTKAMRIGMWERELGARRVIVVGDRSTDITNARAANAYAIGVTFGLGSRGELAGADVLCDTAQQITEACMRVINEI